MTIYLRTNAAQPVSWARIKAVQQLAGASRFERERTIVCLSPESGPDRIPLQLLLGYSKEEAVHQRSGIHLYWNNGTHAGEAPSSCCTAPASPSQA